MNKDACNKYNKRKRSNSLGVVSKQISSDPPDKVNAKGMRRKPEKKDSAKSLPCRRLHTSKGENGRPKGEPESFSDYSLIYEIVQSKKVNKSVR